MVLVLIVREGVRAVEIPGRPGHGHGVPSLCSLTRGGVSGLHVMSYHVFSSL